LNAANRRRDRRSSDVAKEFQRPISGYNQNRPSRRFEKTFKELTTASHAMGRAEERLEADSGFRRRIDQVLKRLHSSMQA
jgi:hypothetical protein